VTFTYDPQDSFPATQALARVRLLINDVREDGHVFEDEEINAFLDLANGAVLIAAAQALDTIADDEALTSKVIRTQDVQTDGTKVADSLRKRAQSLRDQHAATVADADDGYFDIVDTDPDCWPEHSNPAHGWL